MLQWGRNFIVAEICHRASVTVRAGAWLQWGRNFIVAEIWPCWGVWRRRALASMGPQLYRCGNADHKRATCERRCSFNGAATLSLRKSVPGLGLRVPARGFNGAATLSLRKCSAMGYVCCLTIKLQWGRNFIVAEMSHTSCGSTRRCPSFNGAATLSLRKWRHRPQQGLKRHASMGPQLYRCGNSQFPIDAPVVIVLLQWGRNFIVAEIYRIIRPGRRRIPASMGPQLYRCGNRGNRHQPGTGNGASMGPQLYRCGNVTLAGFGGGLYICFNGAATLSLRKFTA